MGADEREEESRLVTAGKTVSVFPAAAPDRPAVYLNTFEGEGGRIREALRLGGCPDFSLIAVSGLDWNHDMAPWDAPAVFRGGAPFTGGAEEYLQLLTDEIVPQAERCLPGPVSRRGIAGYSLAGLFALYALYQSDLFSEAASMSGSLWFPGFREYVLSREMKRRPERLYFSLGDREHRTGNPVMKTVRERTEELCSFFREQGVETVFRLHPGNHFRDAAPRTAAGIAWLLGERS